MLAVVLTLGAMPVYDTFASAGTDEPTVETTDETPTPSVEPVSPEPAAAPAPQGEPEATPTPSAEVTPSQEPEAAPTPGAEPTESPEPENTTYANSVSGTLWLDMFDDIGNSIYAGDGIRQAEEEPLAGYRVELYKADDTDNAIASTTTGADGKYSFENIEPGSYVVGVKTMTMDGVEYLLPLFWLDGTTGDNRFVATYDEAADAYLYAYTAPITVAEDSEITGMDAGMRTVPGKQTRALYNLSSGPVTIAAGSGDHTITGTYTGTTTAITVQAGYTGTITLQNVDIDLSAYFDQAAMDITPGSNVNLVLSGSNTLKSGIVRAGLEVNAGAAVTISGSGSLDIIGGDSAAGIGGAAYGSGGGTITINSGNITATAISEGPGIGNGAYSSSSCTITINGGTVTAVGGSQGAGIGGGTSTTGGMIMIGGTAIVNAVSTYTGAGIGGGYTAAGGTIIIGGSANVTATGRQGAGIGGGLGGNGGTIIIRDSAIVNASTSGGTYGGGAGIGGGDGSGNSGNITITGGTVTATGSSNIYGSGSGMDIGYGQDGIAGSGPIVITGGSVLPTRGASYVSPTPTNSSIYGNDPVHMSTFPQFAGQSFAINTAGSAGTYTYEGVGHTAAGYLWMAYPGVATATATAMSTTAASVTAPSTVNSAGSSTATLNGTYYLNNSYGVASAYFEWGTTTGYGSTQSITPVGTIAVSVEPASASITGLVPGTTYHYRFVIVANGVTVPGADMTFTTPALAPSVDVTHTVTGGTTATLYGIYDLNGSTFVSGLFEISSDNGTTWSTPTGGTLTGLTTTPTVNLTGLPPGMTYQYRFTVTTNVGTNSATGSFTVGFAVTEKFVNLSGSAVNSTGLPENTVNVASSYTASGIPTSHTTGGNTYTYLGYKLDSYTTGDSLTSGTPSSVTITGNRDVYYVYAIAEGSIKIEKYAHDGTTLLPGAEFKLEKLTGPGGTIDTTFTAQTLATGAGGSVTFVNLSAGSYRITETKAPAGYELLTAAFEVDIPKDITYAVGTPPADSSYLYSTTSGSNVIYHYYDVTYKVSDQASIAMPAAGATGTFPSYALWGGGLILLAALGGGILWAKRRRAYAPKHG